MKRVLLLCWLVLLAVMVDAQQVITTWLDYNENPVRETDAACKKIVTLTGDTATTIKMVWFRSRYESIEHYRNGFPAGKWLHSVKGKVQEVYDFTQVIYLLPSQIRERKVADTAGIIPPSFKGGDAARLQFLEKNIKYPPIALKNRYEGISYISFIVKPDGKLTSFAVVKGSNPYLDYEACRVLRSMPRWKPATRNGKAIPYPVILPVKFTLAEEERGRMGEWGISYEL